MQPIRRWYEHRSRGLRRFLQLWHSNQSFWFILILWGITGYRSLRAYRQLAQELRPDNQLCSSSSTCLHIQIPLHLALVGQILSLYMLYEIITTIFWPVDYVGEGILMTEVVLNDWCRWNSLVIVIPSFLVLIFMYQYDNVVPWISGLYAVFRAGLFVAYFILMMHRFIAIVAEERVEEPDQQPSGIESSESNRCGSKQGESDIPPQQCHSILSRVFRQYWLRLITDFYRYIDVHVMFFLILGFVIGSFLRERDNV